MRPFPMLRRALHPPVLLALPLLCVTTTTAHAQLPTRPTGAPSTPTQPLSFTMPLSITSPILAGPVYPGVRTTVTVKVANAKDGSVITVKPVPVSGATCTFITAANAAPVTATANGATSVSVPGMFPYPVTGMASTCAFSAEITATRTDGTTTTTTTTSTSVPIAAPQTYVVTNTTEWLNKLGFSHTAISGDCVGTSNGPSGEFPVGLRTSDGGQPLVDLTFKIRSGPFGTKCRWVSQPIVLPEGVRLMIMETSADVSGPCRSFNGTPLNGAFQSATNPLIANGSVAGANPLGVGYMMYGIAPLNIVLECDRTASNDRYATFTIKSLTFTGPPNLTGFP